MTNVGNLNWLANEAIVSGTSLVGDELTIDVLQDCPFNDIGEFRVKGTVSRFPGSSPRYGGIFLQFRVSDYIGRMSELRIQFDGFSSPTLQILRRGSFYKANLISFDGFRLSVLYSSGNFAATIYLKAPSSEIYALADMKPFSGHYLLQLEGRHSSAFRIDSIALLRNLERNILGRRFEYDVGRLGAEIAYMIATEVQTTKRGNSGAICWWERPLHSRQCSLHPNQISCESGRDYKRLDHSGCLAQSCQEITGGLCKPRPNEKRVRHSYLSRAR